MDHNHANKYHCEDVVCIYTPSRACLRSLTHTYFTDALWDHVEGKSANILSAVKDRLNLAGTYRWLRVKNSKTRRVLLGDWAGAVSLVVEHGPKVAGAHTSVSLRDFSGML